MHPQRDVTCRFIARISELAARQERLQQLELI